MTLNCPYCNAVVTLTAAPTPGEKVVCARCGESFVPSPAQLAGAMPAPAASVPAPPPAPKPTGIDPVQRRIARQSRAMRSIIRTLVVGFVALMLGLIVGLIWQLGNAPTQPSASQPTNRAATPPPDLAALRYLPDNANLLLGVHVQQLSGSPDGLRLLAQLGVVQPHGGRGPAGLFDAPALTGLTLDEIDHLAAAVQIDAAPRFVVVVRARADFDPRQVRDNLKVQPSVRDKRGQLIYPFTLAGGDAGGGGPGGGGPGGGGPGGGLLGAVVGSDRFAWFPPDNRTIVVGLSSVDMDTVPTTPKADPNRFSVPIGYMLQDRLPADAVAWVVGQHPDWRKSLAGLVLAPLVAKLTPNVEMQQAVGAARAFALGMRLGDPVKLLLSVQAGDAKSAPALLDWLSVRVAANQIDIEAANLIGVWATVNGLVPLANVALPTLPK